MTVYVVFLVFILLVGALCYSIKWADRKNELLFLNITWIAMFFLCVLRASSVGRDVPGYESAYLLTQTVPFGDFDYIYFENGYVLLMKLCLFLKMPFQWFLTIVYFIIQTPIYYYIRKCSKNYFLATLVYVCYMFFEFNLTGIRQALAASIVLIGYILYIYSKKHAWLKFLVLVLIASTFHKSALICLVFLGVNLIKSLKNYVITIACGSLGLFFVRGYLLQYLKEFFEKGSMKADAGVYIGLNFFFTLGVAVLFLISFAKAGYYSENGKKSHLLTARNHETNIRLFLLGILALVLFGSDTGARSYMMFSQAMIVQLPNALECWKPQDKRVMQFVVMIFLLAFFFTNSLIPNNFDIVPYRFFWE